MYVYVHVTANTKGEREIQFTYIHAHTMHMSRQTDRHAERIRVYTQYYVYFCQLCMSIGTHTCTCSYMYVHEQISTRTLPYNIVGRLSMAAIRGW